MVGASKILTVSYGTFSCTLEGFDDPFNTMRSIAEYFRDLAAEDRYFGAEPPTPDVSHLHALAQHDNPRPVAAHVQDNGLRLTQGDAAQADAGDTDVDASSFAAAPVATAAATAATLAAVSAATSAPAREEEDEDEDDLALLLDGIEDEGPLELDDEDDGNLFDVEAAEPAPAPKPAYDPRAAIAAKLAAARETVDAEAPAERRPRTPQVSEEDIAAAAAQSPTRALKRPDAFRDDLDSLNEGKSDLSDEDEAALMAELDALQEDAPKGKDGKALLESDLIEREEAALERLLAKTNSKLTDDDVQQKRASLSHLKAAVAATMADRNAGAELDADVDDPNSAYRADLAKAVQPKDAPAAAPQAAQKPAPLVLVADRDATPAGKAQAAKPTGPVRPRRVDSAAKEPRSRKDSDAGFAAYADKVGASDLSEMMEAAAAYLNLVEGADSFTRPQVMHMVLRQERGKNFTREDSLRSFDSLVRKGAIHKVDHGQFAIHEDSRYVS